MGLGGELFTGKIQALPIGVLDHQSAQQGRAGAPEEQGVARVAVQADRVNAVGDLVEIDVGVRYVEPALVLGLAVEMTSSPP